MCVICLWVYFDEEFNIMIYNIFVERYSLVRLCLFEDNGNDANKLGGFNDIF